MRLSELEAVVESLLFIAGDAVPLASIAQTIELDKATARAVVLALADRYEKEKRGLRIVEIEGAFQMCTAAECFEYIRNMYKSPQRQGLTQSLLETLASVKNARAASPTQPAWGICASAIGASFPLPAFFQLCRNRQHSA